LLLPNLLRLICGTKNVLGFKELSQSIYVLLVVLGGVMVIVLANEPKVHGFKPGQE
jgi:hypothetical protein